jgi:hypothetical protein
MKVPGFIIRALLKKFGFALKEFTSIKATETQAMIGALLIKGACLIPNGCVAVMAITDFLEPALQQVPGLAGVDLTPDRLAAFLVAYVGARFFTKTIRADVKAIPAVEEKL